MRKAKRQINEKASELGFDVCRFTTAAAPLTAKHFQDWLQSGSHGTMGYLERNAAKRIDPQLVLPGARSVVCVAASYHVASEPDSAVTAAHDFKGKGIVARYARFQDYHDAMGRQLEILSHFISQVTNGNAQSLWYVDTGPVLEREFAQRAGIGFVGKHTNVISRQFGNWIFLGEILTTAEFEGDAAEPNRCGSCSRCLQACPTRAFDGPFRLDARRCISFLTIENRGPIPPEMRPLLGNRIFGCDDCLEACPWNRFARQGHLMRRHYRKHFNPIELLELVQIDEAAFKTRYQHTPIYRAKHSGLLRNVIVALGNTGEPEAIPLLRRHCNSPNTMIAEHAWWAIQAISQRLHLHPPG